MIIDPIPNTTQWEIHTDPNEVGGETAPIACGYLWAVAGV